MSAIDISGATHKEGSKTMFPSLPEELIKLIFEFACVGGVDVDARRSSASSCSYIDTSTTFSLMLVSRASYTLLAPLLYRSVTISRPSQLEQFSATLLARPSLALLVRNLWVGSLDSPPTNFIPLVVSDVEMAVAAKAHIKRAQDAETRGELHRRRKIHHETTVDLVYLESGAEYAAMHVPPCPDRLVESTASTNNDLVDLQLGLEWSEDTSASSSHSAAEKYGFGVDRAGLGYDAAGEWIGTDEWLLRCLEVQFALEFHWEYVALTAQPAPTMSPTMAALDEQAKRDDPMDWADSSAPVMPLPSRVRQISTDTLASSSSSTAEYMRSGAARIGFHHIQQFFSLRRAGHCPREAARILIERYLQLTTPAGSEVPNVSDVCNIDLLTDEKEMDHFMHPALFARSGAIHLIVPADAPEGFNAPPNAIPAHAAAMTSFNDTSGSTDDDGEDSDEEDIRQDTLLRTRTANGTDAGNRSLDFVDLFGHVQNHARTLYAAVPRSAAPEFSRTLTQQQIKTIGKERLSLRRRPPTTLGSLMANMRTVLALCPRIRVLGLNGFLERAVGGSRECNGLPELRHLSLGPPPPFWSSALNLQQRTLDSLRSLHISGCMLFRSEAMAIGGFTSALPRLREIDWTLWLGHALEHPINVVEALSYLLGNDSVTASANRRLEQVVQRSKPLRRVRATLNTEDVAFWQQNADQTLVNDPRLVLRQCASKEADINLRNVRRWWETKAGLV